MERLGNEVPHHVTSRKVDAVEPSGVVRDGQTEALREPRRTFVASPGPDPVVRLVPQHGFARWGRVDEALRCFAGDGLVARRELEQEGRLRLADEPDAIERSQRLHVVGGRSQVPAALRDVPEAGHENEYAEASLDPGERAPDGRPRL